MSTLRVALEWFLNPDHVPLLLGIENGWFEDAGLTVELIEPKEHFDAFAGMRDGTVDIAITEPIHLLQDLAKGEEMRGFARFLHTNGGVMYLEGRGITRPSDMVGKRIQYPGAPGPGGSAIVNTMIAADGGSPGDLISVNNGFFHTDALADDKADVATLAFYNFEVVEARHRGLPANFFALKDWDVRDFCQLIFIGLPETVASRKGELRAFRSVIHRGIDLIKQDPETARIAYAKATQTDANDTLGRAIFDATIPCFTHDFTLSQAYHEHLAQWLIQTEQVDETLAWHTAWTNRLAL